MTAYIWAISEYGKWGLLPPGLGLLMVLFYPDSNVMIALTCMDPVVHIIGHNIFSPALQLQTARPTFLWYKTDLFIWRVFVHVSIYANGLLFAVKKKKKQY